MQPDNLVLNDPIVLSDGNVDVTPWFEPYHGDGESIHEVLSGRWYQQTALDPENVGCLLYPLVFYVDKTHIDPGRSRFNLEPLNLTFAVFKGECRSLTEFWRTVAYVPAVPDLDVATNAVGATNARNYHTMLEYLLQDLIALHANPSQFDNFPLRIGNHVKLVNLRFPVAFIISDTQGADKLCGRYVSYNDRIKRLHRSCLCSPANATNTTDQCVWVDMGAMMAVTERADKAELNLYSQYYIPSHAFRYVDFGNNPRGIFGATPYDILHGLKLGIIEYILEIFLKDELNDSMRHHLDQALKETLPHLKQGGSNQFPRIYFPNGISSVRNPTAEENVGILFVIYVLSVTSQGRQAILSNIDKFSVARLNIFQSIFEKLLTFEAWMSKKSGYWKLGNDPRAKNRASRSIKDLMKYICDNFTRKSNQDWNLSKMHELMHVTHFIDQYGSPCNYDAGPCERMHKDVAKRPGRLSQKRHATFTLQAANRLADSLVLDFAHKHLVDEVPTNDNNTSHRIGSSFVLCVSANANGFLNVSIVGNGSLSDQDLSRELYPGLVEFVVAYFSRVSVDTFSNILCCTEYIDESNNIYRAHHCYRLSGFWHDWAWVSYKTEAAEDGFRDVPAKILCFLPHGIPGDTRCHVVCHPCNWRSQNVTQLVKSWTLLACHEATTNQIPYDVVPVTALFGHCFVVPDLRDPGTIYQFLDKKQWPDKFCN
jgi:hypothetical protein